MELCKLLLVFGGSLCGCRSSPFCLEMLRWSCEGCVPCMLRRLVSESVSLHSSQPIQPAPCRAVPCCDARCVCLFGWRFACCRKRGSAADAWVVSFINSSGQHISHCRVLSRSGSGRLTISTELLKGGASEEKSRRTPMVACVRVHTYSTGVRSIFLLDLFGRCR